MHWFVSQYSHLESESGDSSDSEERRRKKKRRKDKRRSGSFKRSKSRSVSPLSKRAAMQNNRPISPFSAKLNPGMGMNLPGMNESNLPGMMGDVGMNVSSGYNEPAATRPHQGYIEKLCCMIIYFWIFARAFFSYIF